MVKDIIKLVTEHIDLSICIVNWNGGEVLTKCLRSIDHYRENLAIEIIVVDNASTDDSVEMIEREFPNVTLIKSHTNLGYGRANNKAIEKSVGKNILILNSDILLKEPVFNKMIQFLGSRPDVGCIGCKIINNDGSIQKSYHKTFPTPFTEFKQGMLFNRIYDILLRRNRAPSGDIEVSWIVGACMMFRQEVIKSLVGFDDTYFMYGEDIDLCYRTFKLGYKIIYLGSIEMIHFHAVASGKKKKRYFSAVLQRESVYRFMKTHYNGASVIVYRLAWMVSGLVRIILLLPVYLILKMFVFDTKNLGSTIEKYIRIISWSIGKEKWTRQQIPD